jgi:SNF2 family DNA or RNA helicase
MQIALQPHQERVAQRFKKSKAGLVVVHGLGTGKTRTALATQQAVGGAADVVVPASLKAHWRGEAAKWGAKLKNLTFHSEQGISRSGFSGTAPILIQDEGHRGRNVDTKLARALGKSPARKLILTGTPIYNKPGDLGVLVNQAAGRKVLAEGAEFERRYLMPGKIARFFGRKTSHTGELGRAVKEFVDYHPGGGDLPKVTERTTTVKMGRQQNALYHAAMGQIPLHLRVQLRRSDVDEKTLTKLRPYLTGPRMISNTTAAVGARNVEEPKIERAVEDLRKHLAKPGGKALVYSNWLAGGVEPMKKRLAAAGIQYGTFTGAESSGMRQSAVRDYNEGRKRVLLVSSSGGEGLDLKGTRMVQVLEPHFNRSKIDQVIGRSARIGSHTALPESERNVKVVHYVAKPSKSWFRVSPGVDTFLTDLSKWKQGRTKALIGVVAKAQRRRDMQK